MNKLFWTFFIFLYFSIPLTFASADFNLLLVDKDENKIHLAKYIGEKIEIFKSFHATLGKVVGDKEIENDLKTPEGVYFFTQKLLPPNIKKKYGRMALLMDYPNPIDKLSGKSGYDIMLHATDDPTRLTRKFDSEGCVVVDNPEIEEISEYIVLGLTPIIIYPKLKQEYLHSGGKPEVQKAFARWIASWRTKDLQQYIGSYLNSFKYNGMNLRQYKEYKQSLNQRYKDIQITAENVRYFYHPKYDVVEFMQKYESSLRGGGRGFKSSGTKLVYFVKDGHEYKIATERFTNQAAD